jgi:hypothetical protein
MLKGDSARLPFGARGVEVGARDDLLRPVRRV